MKFNKSLISLLTFFISNSSLHVCNGRNIQYVQRGLITRISWPLAAVPVDIDNDGDIDVIVGSPIVVVAKNDGNGIFTWNTFGGVDSFISQKVNDVSVSDLDGDDALDIVAAYQENTVDDTAISWWKNVDGEANEMAQTVLVSSNFRNDGNTYYGMSAKAVDMDGDGDTDIVCVVSSKSNDRGYLLYLENDGTGGFTTTAIASDIGGRGRIVVEDMDGDGMLDIVVLSATRRIMWLYYKTSTDGEEKGGDLSFLSTVVDATVSDDLIDRVTVGDLNGDGMLDIVATGKDVYAYQNLGDRKFSSEVQLWRGGCLGWDGCGKIKSVLVWDADGDGDNDITFTNGFFRVNMIEQVSDGVFGPLTTLVDNVASPYTHTYGDINGDGLVDIITNAVNDNNMYYYLAERIPTNSPSSRPTASPSMMPSSLKLIPPPTTATTSNSQSSSSASSSNPSASTKVHGSYWVSLSVSLFITGATALLSLF